MTDETTGYLTSVEQLEAHRTERTKVLLFVSPSNPTGAVYPPEQVAEIGRWAAETGIWVITDEIYEHLVYGDARFVSMPVVAPELADRCVVLNGVAKTYAMTGWRVGWMIGPRRRDQGGRRTCSRTLTSNVCNVAQAAALAAVSGDLSAVAAMRAAFDRRRQLHDRHAQRDPRRALPAARGRVLLLPVASRACSAGDRGRPATDSAELAEVILDEAEVAVVPGEAFGTQGYFRLSCALGDADLEEGHHQDQQAARPGALTRRPAGTRLWRWPGRLMPFPRRICICISPASMRHATLVELAGEHGIRLPEALVADWPPS